MGLCAILFAVVLLARGHARRVAIPAPGPVPSLPALAPVPAADASSAAQPALVVVDIEGKVAHPGVQRLTRGARVIDAVSAAGGLLPGASTTSLDLARLVVDGEQLRVDLPPAAVVPAAPGGSSGTPTEPVNLNTASVTELEALPGVGPVTAQHIVDWRSQHGRFTAVEQLQEVPGIGPTTYSRLAPLATV